MIFAIPRKTFPLAFVLAVQGLFTPLAHAQWANGGVRVGSDGGNALLVSDGSGGLANT